MFKLSNQLRRSLCVLPMLAAVFTSTIIAAAPASIGRPATTAEIKAWDIDVRPDFKGLPTGSGSALKGQELWEAKCESCHGTFGESNEFFTPIIGHTTAQDVKTGHVAALAPKDGSGVPQRTTMMKLAQLSTLWDYINRAMPWNAPKSLATDEVYALTAYILNMSNVVPNDFVLSDKNMSAAQALLPNRNGLTEKHGLRLATDKPDAQGELCMNNCKAGEINSRLPDYARNAHGNLAQQSRNIGGVRGADTTQPAPTTFSALKPATSTPLSAAPQKTASELAIQHTCLACHGTTNKLIGPAFSDVQKKYGAGSSAQLVAKIKAGGSGVWGAIPMPPQAHLPEVDIQAIADWIAKGNF